MLKRYHGVFGTLGKMNYFYRNNTSLNSPNMNGKVAVITGANTGIGLETAIGLGKRGASLILGCRDMERSASAIQRIKTETGVDVKLIQLNLASFQSIRNFATETLAYTKEINILINNGGVMMIPQSKTVNGFETQFATNHLGHFLLTHLLLDRLKESAPARIINVSSSVHSRVAAIDFDDLNLDKNYDANYAYAHSKLANILFTKALAKRLEGTRVNTYALHPGAVKTELGRHIWGTYNMFAAFLFNFVRLFFKNSEQGAQTSIFCACSEDLENKTGLYYANCAECEPSSLAKDPETAERLYKVSLQMVGLPEES